MQNHSMVVLAFVLLPWLAGCGRGDGRQSVSGAVLLDGKPLASGAVHFRCVEGRGDSAGGPVRDGQFSIPASHGLSPGKYAVAVQAYRPTGRIVHDPGLGDREEVAQVRFREGDSITATVTAGARNHFDFQLTSEVPAVPIRKRPA